MPTIPPTFQALRVFGRAALIANILGSVTVLGYGFYELQSRDQIWGLALVGTGLAALALGVLLYAHVSLMHKTNSLSFRSYDTLLDIAELMQRQAEHTRTISENSSLSDWAKRVVYREKDYEFLRDTIHSAIVRQDWAGAERFIKDLKLELGLHDEATRLRQELNQAQQATTEEKVAAALERFDSLCDQRKWEQAGDELERLKTLFPSDQRIAALPDELELRRQKYKRKLLKQYDVAVRLQSVDDAHRLLLELDHYLSPDEVAVLKESARGVFKAKLFQMGVQFSLAVSDKKFHEAVSIGQRIMREFPNSRYAQEIGGMMMTLRKRAGQEAAGAGA